MQSYWTFELFQGFLGHLFLPTLEGWVGPVGRKLGRKKCVGLGPRVRKTGSPQ